MYSNNGLSNATLYDPTSKADIIKGLTQDGFIIIEKRPGKRFQKIVSKIKFRTFRHIFKQNLHNLIIFMTNLFNLWYIKFVVKN